MSKKANIVLTVIVVVALLVSAYLIINGKALNVTALGESFTVSISEGKDTDAMTAKFNDFLGKESTESEKISKLFAVAYYLIVIGIIAALITSVCVLFSKFQKYGEYTLISLAFFAIAGLLYTIIQSKTDTAVKSAAGIWGGLMALSITTDGLTLLWLCGILFVSAAIIVYVAKDKTKISAE